MTKLAWRSALAALLLPIASVPAVAGAPGTASGVEARATAPCSSGVTGPFRPVQGGGPTIGSKYKVLAMARLSSGAMATPPVNDTGKHQYAWDKASKAPGSGHGSVPIDAHTWPDGSALGNKMLSNLHVGDIFVLRGAYGQKQCYKINFRQSYPRDQVPAAKFFTRSGPPHVSIIVCSGRRLGPGNWTRRTVWFGVPIQ
jgi:hypothetical protein